MRYSKISIELFLRNRRKLYDLLPSGALAIVHSNDQMVRNGDQYFPYRQSSDFFYLTGIEQEMSVLAIFKAQGKNPGPPGEELLFLRKPEPKLETWEGKKLDRKAAEGISGISNIFWMDEMITVLKERCPEASQLFFNIPDFEKFKPEYPLRDERLKDEIIREYSSAEIGKLPEMLTAFRLIKESEELSLIREAVSITLGGLRRVLGFVEPGIMEYEVEAELSHEFLKAGCNGHAYPPIIASGVNACMLHYLRNDQECRDGELLLMDFGAEYANYAADCSRTIPVNGRYNQRQLNLYNSCLRVFWQARELFRPGINIDEINTAVREFWEKQHVELGLYSMEDLRMQEEENPLYRKYYPHGTAHFLGLDVHDVGSKNEALKPGMVLTCEPGIYLSEEGVGIRIENDLLITETGCMDLMSEYPIEAEEIEELMNRN